MLQLQGLIEEAAETGKLHPELFKLVQTYVRMIPESTQEIEGVNGIIKHVLDQFPATGLLLLNSRVLGRKMQSLRVGASGANHAIEDEVKECVQNHMLGKAALQDRTRHFNDGTLMPALLPLPEPHGRDECAALPAPAPESTASPVQPLPLPLQPPPPMHLPMVPIHPPPPPPPPPPDPPPPPAAPPPLTIYTM